MLDLYFKDQVEISYCRVNSREVKETLPALKVNGKVVKENCIPDLDTLIYYVRNADAA
jgi:hypothetical protein